MAEEKRKGNQVKETRNSEKSNEFPLHLLEIVLTAFLISTLLKVVEIIDEAGYDVIIYFFRYPMLHIPFLLGLWIYYIGYSNREILSINWKRNTFYITSLIIILASLAQIGELSPLMEEGLCIQETLLKYMEEGVIHPFCCTCLFLILWIISSLVKEPRRFWFSVIIAAYFWAPVIRNFPAIVLKLCEIFWLKLDGKPFGWNIPLIAFFCSITLLLLKDKILKIWTRGRRKEEMQ